MKSRSWLARRMKLVIVGLVADSSPSPDCGWVPSWHKRLAELIEVICFYHTLIHLPHAPPWSPELHIIGVEYDTLIQDAHVLKQR